MQIINESLDGRQASVPKVSPSDITYKIFVSTRITLIFKDNSYNFTYLKTKVNSNYLEQGYAQYMEKREQCV